MEPKFTEKRFFEVVAHFQSCNHAIYLFLEAEFGQDSVFLHLFDVKSSENRCFGPKHVKFGTCAALNGHSLLECY